MFFSILGAGGSEAFAAPSKELSFAFVMNRMKLAPEEISARTLTIIQWISEKVNEM